MYICGGVRIWNVVVIGIENDMKLQVEITCRGQQLLPFLTLQHVRDNIWSLREAPALLPDSSTTTTDHVMVLHYARTASTSASN